MKATSNIAKKEFKPIDLTLTIESESELRTLYSLFANTSNSHIAEMSRENPDDNFEVEGVHGVTGVYDIYLEIERICKRMLGE